MNVKAGCHCGATQFEVPALPEEVTICNCSFCTKRGLIGGHYTPDEFKLLTARDRVSTYQWGSYTLKHHHCSICGCGTYTESPSWTDEAPDFAHPKVIVNARLLPDFDLKQVKVIPLNGREW